MIDLAALTTLLLAFPPGAPGSIGPAVDATADTTLVLGNQPTVVAFFSVPSETFVEQPSLSEVLADFHNFLADARGELRALMVDVHQAYGRPIRLRTTTGERDLPIGSGLPVGYFLWSPGEPAYVCRGVRVGPALVDLVREYLAAPAEPGPALARCERNDP